MKKPKRIDIVNMSGEKFTHTDWLKGDKALALNVVSWLSPRCGGTVALSTTHDGAILLDYALDGVLQPTLRIYAGKVVWPRGTDFELMMSFLSGEE